LGIAASNADKCASLCGAKSATNVERRSVGTKRFYGPSELVTAHPNNFHQQENDMSEANTDDVMRMNYRPLSKEESEAVLAIKGNAASLYGFFGTLGASRELSLAKTKIEEAVMWATKHVTR
jgi:hypothetical protein